MVAKIILGLDLPPFSPIGGGWSIKFHLMESETIKYKKCVLLAWFTNRNLRPALLVRLKVIPLRRQLNSSLANVYSCFSFEVFLGLEPKFVNMKKLSKIKLF